MTKTPAQLDAEIAEENDKTLVKAWKATGKPLYDMPNYNEVAAAIARQKKRAKLAKADQRAGKGAKLTNVTSLNLFTLANLVAKNGGHVRFPNRIEATDRNGIMRCMEGKYIQVDGRDLALTATGKQAVADYYVSELEREAKSPTTDPYYLKRQRDKVELFERALATLSSERAA